MMAAVIARPAEPDYKPDTKHAKERELVYSDRYDDAILLFTLGLLVAITQSEVARPLGQAILHEAVLLSSSAAVTLLSFCLTLGLLRARTEYHRRIYRTWEDVQLTERALSAVRAELRERTAGVSADGERYHRDPGNPTPGEAEESALVGKEKELQEDFDANLTAHVFAASQLNKEAWNAWAFGGLRIFLLGLGVTSYLAYWIAHSVF